MNKEKQYIFYDLVFAEQHPELSAIDLLIYFRIKGFAETYGNYNKSLSDIAKSVHSSEQTARRTLRKLIEIGLIEETKENGKTTAYRPLTNCNPLQNVTPYNLEPHPLQNVTPNNKYIINNNNRKNIEVAPKKSKFQKPTIDEIAAYCQERQNGIDAVAFFDFYESKGWVVGKSPMKDWRAAVRTWENKRKNEKPYGNNNNTCQTATTAANTTEAKPYSRIQQLGNTRFNLK